MRKIHVLKAIIDFVWIFSIPLIPLIIISIPLLFIYEDFGDFIVNLNGIELNAVSMDVQIKIFLIISFVSYLLILYSIYLFRKILSYFLRLKIFDHFVILSFNKIGNLLIIAGLLSVIVKFIFRIYYQQQLKFEIGISPQIMIVCLGLFFMVLSEIFKISKTMKEENDLTV